MERWLLTAVARGDAQAVADTADRAPTDTETQFEFCR
jgi:hypothetical protein